MKAGDKMWPKCVYWLSNFFDNAPFIKATLVFKFILDVIAMIIFISLFLISLFAGCTSTSTTPTTSGWTQTYGHNLTLKPTGNGFTFDFPQSDGVHYITKPSGPLKIGQTITVTYKITGSGFKTVQANIGKPAFRLMIQKGSDMHTQFGRYWSVTGVELKATGQTTFSVNITPELWSDVYGGKGTEHLAEFKRTLAECGHVGITFGGTAGGYGHGTYATGKATFTLIDLTVK